MTRAVVIGAGPNGLAAAIRLAEHGIGTTVLEAQPEPGGAVRTQELTMPGFRHDTFSAVYPAGVASPVFGRMPLDQHGLEWVHPPVAMAHPLEDGTAVALTRDLPSTVASLEAQHPGDGHAWARFVRPYLDHFDALRATMLAGFPPVSGVAQLVLGAPVASARFGMIAALPGRVLARHLFTAPGSRAWLLGSSAHGDAGLNAPGSALPAFYLNLLGNAVGWPSPRGGAGALTDALVGHLRALGGEVVCGAPVERILASGSRVTGVGVGDGRTVEADVVLADVMPRALLAMAGPAIGGWYRRGLRRYRQGPATLKLDWALDGPIPWSAPEARTAGTVHVGGSEAALIDAMDLRDARRPPFLLLGQQSLADPSRAPAGCHTAWAYTRMRAGWTREAAVEAIEAQVERFAPGFGARILARHVLDAAAMQSRNANLVDGDVGGGSYRGLQAVFRPLPALSPYRTPLEGLFLASAAAFPGAAVHGVPGDAAANAAMRWLRGARS